MIINSEYILKSLLKPYVPLVTLQVEINTESVTAFLRFIAREKVNVNTYLNLINQLYLIFL